MVSFSSRPWFERFEYIFRAYICCAPFRICFLTISIVSFHPIVCCFVSHKKRLYWMLKRKKGEALCSLRLLGTEVYPRTTPYKGIQKRVQFLFAQVG